MIHGYPIEINEFDFDFDFAHLCEESSVQLGVVGWSGGALSIHRVGDSGICRRAGCSSFPGTAFGERGFPVFLSEKNETSVPRAPLVFSGIL